ncbi:hypothetical protein RJ639_044674 [Escallonia herrerae]|uniref:Uncharacterized protein n=1 Tax=Escallonia herrerae TaxID=1293975 RepID=A0AA89B4P8_9ASTE|nr:hypothetical protein RJ639_044674 [Escallonia herrerae]
MDERRRIVYYGSDETDEAGGFEMIINKYINGKELRRNGCFVRLVQSPDPVCNIATDFGGGRTGVRLSRPTVVYRDLIKHVLGPFYYTTPMCDEPDTDQVPTQDTLVTGVDHNAVVFAFLTQCSIDHYHPYLWPNGYNQKG